MKKKTFVWLLVIGIWFSVSGLVYLGTDLAAALLTLAIGVVLIVIAVSGRRKAQRKAVQMHAQQAHAPASAAPTFTASTVANDEDKWPKTVMLFTLGICEKLGDYRLKYRYKNVSVQITDMNTEPGCKFEISDSGELLIKGQVVGTMVVPGRLLDMVRDWNRRGDPYAAGLLKLNEDGSGEMYLGFYVIPTYHDERICKLTASGSQAKQERLSCASEGDPVDIEDEDGSIVVFFKGEPIGHLGRADSIFFEEEIGGGLYEGEIFELREDEIGKISAKIRIRY